MDAMSLTLEGRTVVMTGGAGILPSAIARGLVTLGARVALVDLDGSKAETLAEELDAGADRAMGLYGDVLTRRTLEDARDAVVDRWGTIDALVSGAGGNHPAATTSTDTSFFDLPRDGIDKVFDLNVTGTILPCQVFGAPMAARGRGSIVTIASMNAFRPLTRIPAYSAAKAAVANFTRWLAVTMAREHGAGLRVNAIAPGFFLTAQNRFLLLDEAGDLTERGRTIITHTPQGRFGTPEELVGPVAWLLSDAAAFVTGTVIPIDGGFDAFSGV